MKKFIVLTALAISLMASSAFAYDQARIDRVSQLMTSSAFGFSTAAFYPSSSSSSSSSFYSIPAWTPISSASAGQSALANFWSMLGF